MMFRALSFIFLSLSQFSTCLNILILGAGPFGNKNSKVLHSYLDSNSKNCVISVSPLHAQNQYSSEIYFDQEPVSSKDFEESFQVEDTELTTKSNIQKLLNLSIGDHYYDEKLPNMWYIKSSPLASMLFALDFVIPRNYSHLQSIDLIIIGPNEDKTIGVFDQLTKVTSQMMKFALLRNIPTIHLSGLQMNPSNNKILSLDDNGLDSTNADLIEAFKNLDNLIHGLAQNSFNNGKHQYHTSLALKHFSSLDSYKSNEDKSNQNRLLPNGVGLNINFNIRSREKCGTLNNPIKFTQTRSIRGYNRLLTLDYNQDKDEFELKQTYNIDENLKVESNGAYPSELTTDDKSCVISVTPVSWRGDDYEGVEFLNSIFSELNDNNISSDFAQYQTRFARTHEQLKLIGQFM